MTTWRDECIDRRRKTWMGELWITAGVITVVLLVVPATRAANNNLSTPTNETAFSSSNTDVSTFLPEEDLNKWFACPMSSNGHVVAWADLADIWRKTPDADASPVEDLTLPIEFYTNGQMRAVLHAGKAAVGSKNNLIWAWKVNVDMFDPNGKADGNVKADACLYDRNTKRGYCPAAVKLVKTNATISGTGMYWTMSDDRMRIFSNAVVTVDRAATKQPFAGGKRK